MNPAQFKEAIAKLGLSQVRAGLWLGRDRRTGQRYAARNGTVDPTAAKLIKLALALGLTADEVDELVE